MSSVAMMMRGCLRSTAPSSTSSARVYAAPVGLLGLLSMNMRDRGVMAASSCAAVIL